jgi:hypothetical protein
MFAGLLGLVIGFCAAALVVGLIMRRQSKRAIRDVYGL